MKKMLGTLTSEMICLTRAALAKTLEKTNLELALGEEQDLKAKAGLAATFRASEFLTKNGIGPKAATRIILWNEEDKLSMSLEATASVPVTRKDKTVTMVERKLMWTLPLPNPKAIVVKAMVKPEPKVIITRETLLTPKAEPSRLKIMLIGGTDEDRAAVFALVREIHKDGTVKPGAEIDPSIVEIASSVNVKVELVPVS